MTPEQLKKLETRCRITAQRMTHDECKTALNFEDPRILYEAMYLWRSIKEVEKSGFEYTLNHF